MSDANEGPQGPGKRAGANAGFSAARGAVLVAIAVIIGIVLLQAIDDGNSGPIGDGGAAKSTTSSTTAATTPTSTGGADTSSTTAKATTLAPADTTVKVLNGSGVQGAATTVTNTLKSKGYKTLLPNTVVVQKGTDIFYASGRQAECKALTAYVPNATVAAVADPPPGGEAADCIVVLGN
jgi:hypothetical protein